MRPMLATRGTHVPSGEEWVHEVKWDGMRVLVDVRDGRPRLTSRNENDVTVSFPELHALPGDDLLLDAEVVAFLDGIPTFGALQERIHVGSPKRAAALAERNPVTLLAFDVLRLDGRDLTREPLDVRRGLLTGLGLDEVAWQVPPVYDDGAMLFQATLDQGLEGMVSKRRSSRYEFGVRSPHWLKFPHRWRTSW
ncbi:MAG: DNA ligase, partial [Nocardioides sp.]